MKTTIELLAEFYNENQYVQEAVKESREKGEQIDADIFARILKESRNVTADQFQQFLYIQ